MTPGRSAGAEEPYCGAGISPSSLREPTVA